MKETLIDIETYCEADIKKCGLYRYVSDPSFEILLIAWATDEGEGFGETKLADLASGDPFPKELLDDFKDSDVTLIAHNAAFERVSFSRYLQQHYPGQYLKPGTFLSPDDWICTMVMAASLTLPMALKDVGEVLKTTQQKDEEGKRFIKLFSAPCKPTKSNGGRTRNLPHHLPEDWAKFKYYCIQDVNTEVDIYKRLKRFPMPAREWHHYRVNERINDRGVRIDTELVQQAITCDLLLSDAMTTKAYELTGLENPNSVSQLKTWLDERGISMDTLGKKNVTEMIGELDKNGVDAEAMDMFNSELKRIVVKGCNENDRDALRWCVAKPDKRKSRKMSCRLFSELLYKEMDWSVDCRYKILGYRIEFEGEALYVFDLVAAEVFHERKKKSADHQSTTVVEENKEEQPVNPRKGYYPEDIAGTFGVPVEQHRQESELRQMDGFVSVGILTGIPGQQQNL